MTLPLDIRGAAPLVLAGTASWTRADVRRMSSLLESDLRRPGVTRFMVVSEQPSRILAAIDAASRAGADLWIAHADLPDEVIDRAAQEHEVGLIVGDEEQRMLDVRPAAASSRICLMTSGTTGRPKVAAYTQEHLVDRFANQPGLAAIAGSRWLMTYQPTTFAGLQVMLTALYSGGALILAETRSPQAFLDAAEQHAVTHISGTPTFWRSLLMAATPRSLRALRQVTLGGEAVDQPTLDRIHATFPQARITHMYASTEAGVVFSVNDSRAGFPAAWLSEGVQGSQLRIRDGLLEVRAPRQMAGYLGGAVAAPFAEDGWLRTGDRVAVDGDRVRFLGRLDSVINVGGSKVDPFAVETFLLGLEGVAEARVTGIRNPITGFVVAAEIVLTKRTDPQTACERILAECYIGLPGAHVPRVLRIVDSIQALQSGKKAV
jgi:acyl-CoA synthetase (AMP-forming)/AMP-acid ligase II